MATEDLEKWWEDNLDSFDDEDFDGDIPEALADAMRRVAERNAHGNPRNDIEGWLSGFTSGSYAGGVKERLQERAREPLLERIKAARTTGELNQIEYDRLSGGLRGLKADWTNQEKRIVFRERAVGLSAEDIAARRSRSVSKFANFYNLDEDEARDLLQDKGVLNAEGEIKFLEEL